MNLKIYISILAAILFGIHTVPLRAQPIAPNSKVISAGGSSIQTGQTIVNSTLGESFISSKSINNQYVGHGFQTTHLPVLTTSIHTESANLELRVYPNPFSHEIFLEGDFSPDHLILLNLQGQQVGYVKSPGNSVSSWGHLPPGTYILQGIYNGNLFYIGKILKINS